MTCAVRVEELRVERLADGQRGNIVGDHAVEEGARLRALHLVDAHVADVEQPGGVARRQMFFDDRRVPHRHVPAGERDHLGAQLPMGGVKGGLLRLPFRRLDPLEARQGAAFRLRHPDEPRLVAAGVARAFGQLGDGAGEGDHHRTGNALQEIGGIEGDEAIREIAQPRGDALRRPPREPSAATPRSVRVTTALRAAPATLSVQRAETPGFRSSVRALIAQRSMSSASGAAQLEDGVLAAGRRVVRVGEVRVPVAGGAEVDAFGLRQIAHLDLRGVQHVEIDLGAAAAAPCAPTARRARRP